jgi:TRAP transporter TAXI family solute receptor
MVAPDRVAARIPRRMRALLVGCAVVLVSAAGLFAYRYYNAPKTMTVAVGSSEGDVPGLMSAISGHLTRTGSRIRLQMVDAGSVPQASQDFSAGKVDLAIIRADIADLPAARTVVLVTHAIAMIIVPPGSTVQGIADLKGKTVGVVGEEINRRLVELLTRQYDLALGKVQFQDLAVAEVPGVLRSRQISAVLLVTPISGSYLAQLRDFFPANANQKSKLIPIETAKAIANVAKAYESYELPKGALRGSPLVPEDDLTTLRVPFHLVANKNIEEDDIADLTRAIMEVRRELLAEYPLLAQIAAPSPDKDAYIPIHPGAALFYEGTQKSFYEKYGDALYAIPILLGMLAWLTTAIWNFVRVRSSGKPRRARAVRRAVKATSPRSRRRSTEF